MTLSAPQPITATVRQPLSEAAWLEQYRAGKFLTGPFGLDDPQLAFRVRDELGLETPENVTDWLADNAVRCDFCERHWLYDDEGCPEWRGVTNLCCEECAK